MQELCRRLPTLTLFVQLHVFQEDFPLTPAKAPRYGTKPLRLPSGQDLIQLFVDPNDPRLQPKYGTFSAEQALYMGGIPPLQGVVLHNNQSSSMIIFIPELKEIYKQALQEIWRNEMLTYKSSLVSIFCVVVFAANCHADSIKFTGQDWDGNANTYYMRARYYDPETGTFISKDPIGLNGGVNMYGYCGNNPVNLVDPMGMAGGYLPTSIGDIGENMLTAILGGEPKGAFNTSDGCRFVDVVTQNSTDQEIANESKVGYQTLTAAIQRQILKDAELIGKGTFVDAVWHFFQSPVTGQVGASWNLRSFLDANGITAVYYDQNGQVTDVFSRLGVTLNQAMATTRRFRVCWQLLPGNSVSFGGGVALGGQGGTTDFSFSSTLSSDPLSFGLSGSTGFNSSMSSLDVGGVLIDKAATLVNASLSDIKGAT